MPKVGVVTAYVPLEVRHLAPFEYDRYFDVVRRALGDVNIRCFRQSVEECWLLKALGDSLPMAVEKDVPLDRYADVRANVLSNVVQHNRTEWAMTAMREDPSVDVWVWLDYGIAKQGEGFAYPVNEENLARFFRSVGTRPLVNEVPFPGMAEAGPVNDTGSCWRFCGSTHVWPREWLPAIDAAYRQELMAWIQRNRTTPLDLPIWALVERNHPEIPYRWYAAEYGSPQLDNYPTEATTRERTTADKVQDLCLTLGILGAQPNFDVEKVRAVIRSAAETFGA